MILIFIIISFVFSKIKFLEKKLDFISDNKSYISAFFYSLSILSFLFLANENTIKETWNIAMQLLRIILFLPILAKVFDLSFAKKMMIFRKEIGILMWIMAIVHSAQYFIWDMSLWFWEIEFWIDSGWITYLWYWFIATFIAIILTITSNTYSQKLLWKKWKILHRSVYILLIFTLLHIILVKISKHWTEVLFETIPLLILYIFWKFLEYKKYTFKYNKKDYIKLILSILFSLSLVLIISFFIIENDKNIKTKNIEVETLKTIDNTIKDQNLSWNKNNIFKWIEKIETKKENETNLKDIISLCNSLCKNDSDSYCLDKQKVIFESWSITKWTCRSLGKYNKDFKRCKWFCQRYSQNKWKDSYCRLEDWSIDRWCDG